MKVLVTIQWDINGYILLPGMMIEVLGSSDNKVWIACDALALNIDVDKDDFEEHTNFSGDFGDFSLEPVV